NPAQNGLEKVAPAALAFYDISMSDFDKFLRHTSMSVAKQDPVGLAPSPEANSAAVARLAVE
ncbi:MAG: hypothetical protein IE919_13780, partial [Thioclava sp.]